MLNCTDLNSTWLSLVIVSPSDMVGPIVVGNNGVRMVLHTREGGNENSVVIFALYGLNLSFVQTADVSFRFVFMK